ncbi:MAG: hypothetical protein BMS9Abin33_0763 [Gammaproteobacteria bacterium]|nr:MAG: hypothetical protein BMS9Abin33_0763 [Gammaproteobacteria bacterium]
MIGKKNIVLGFLYLVLTAGLGPVMILNYYDARDNAETSKQTRVGELQQIVQDNFEADLEPMTAEQIAKMNSKAILALSARQNAQVPIDAIRKGPHAHGNLEAILNILAGFLLCFLAINRTFKQLISWTFILGAAFHSGLLYLSTGLNLSWAVTLMSTPVAYIGPVLVLAGLVLAGIAAVLGFRGTIEPDY